MSTRSIIRPADRPGRRLLRSVTASCVLASLLILTGQSKAAGGKAIPPEDARAMTGVELYMLYRNKTWKWEHGAGRMDDDGRAFKAWSEARDNSIWATGRWIVTDSGLFCMKANWHTPSGIHADKTCFRHRISGRTIYQKKEPSGDWYVFKHAVPKDGEESEKLVAEDLVSAKLELLAKPSKASPEEPPLQQQ